MDEISSDEMVTMDLNYTSPEGKWNLTEDADYLLNFLSSLNNRSGYETSTELMLRDFSNTMDSQFFNLTQVKGSHIILNLYDILIPLIGFLIIFLNLAVVISSGLILKGTAQPRTTYLFLGNVAMSDLVTGVSVIFGQYYPKQGRTHLVCSMQIGMIVSSTLASIWSVGLIAIDRFLYIVHGIQYQQWVFPSRARLGILATWILGIIIGFLPAMGWSGIDSGRICWFINLAPPPLILITSFAGFLPVVLVIILYSIILYHALKKLLQLKQARKEATGKPQIHRKDSNKIRVFRGGQTDNNTKNKPNKTSKWKAIKVVLFTTGSFVICWVPYFMAAVLYVFCDKGEDGKGCKTLRVLIGSPLAILGFMNSLLNPIIYAWWHNGFREFVKKKILVHFKIPCRQDNSSTKDRRSNTPSTNKTTVSNEPSFQNTKM